MNDFGYYIGVDPGKNGGIAVIARDLTRVVSPMIPGGKYIDFKSMKVWIRHNCNITMTIAGVEKVSAMPKQGVTSMFSFGVAFGGMLGVISALEIPIVLVPPQRWKKFTLVDTDRSKEAAITFCKMRYPDVNLYATERSKKPHSGICDALCIAHYMYCNY